MNLKVLAVFVAALAFLAGGLALDGSVSASMAEPSSSISQTRVTKSVDIDTAGVHDRILRGEPISLPTIDGSVTFDSFLRSRPFPVAEADESGTIVTSYMWEPSVWTAWSSSDARVEGLILSTAETLSARVLTASGQSEIAPDPSGRPGHFRIIRESETAGMQVRLAPEGQPLPDPQSHVRAQYVYVDNEFRNIWSGWQN